MRAPVLEKTRYGNKALSDLEASGRPATLGRVVKKIRSLPHFVNQISRQSLQGQPPIKIRCWPVNWLDRPQMGCRRHALV
jgi:hypothetical protein